MKDAVYPKANVFDFTLIPLLTFWNEKNVQMKSLI